MSLSISNKTKKVPPKLPYEDIAAAVLGKHYELSLVFCGNALSRRLNHTFRGKDRPTNVLSFPLSQESGEIFVNLYGLGGFGALELFIHGLLHLKGMEHGRKMELAERNFQKRFSITNQSNGTAPRSRYRHRKLQSQGNHRRRAR